MRRTAGRDYMTRRQAHFTATRPDLAFWAWQEFVDLTTQPRTLTGRDATGDGCATRVK